MEALKPKDGPVAIGVGGLTSDVGKTTLMRELLRAFPGWEAIKTTRGHYRSCGKDPDACCVSDLLSDEAVVRSGRDETYSSGKDTGYYWDSGAANVHWVIATDNQIGEGIKSAFGRVTAPGVFIEGNSFSNFLATDFMIMVARAAGGNIKRSARHALAVTSAIYISDPEENPQLSRERFDRWRGAAAIAQLSVDFPIFTRADLPLLVSRIREIQSARPQPQLATELIA